MPTGDVNPYQIGPGKVIGERFEVLRPYRQGGLSTAFEVIDRASPEGVHRELQIFPPSLFDGAKEAEEFAATWQPWKRVESEHVQRVRDIALMGPDTLLLVSDLPQGECLREQARRLGRLPEPLVIELGLQLLDGLGAIHAHGLVHGDVKPLTVWIRTQDEKVAATLVDGGATPGLWSAKQLGERTALIGTPYYAPIEQFGGEAPTVQSDVYNLATLLFELATGVQPFKGRTFLEVFQSKLERVPPTVRQRAPEVTLDNRLEQVIRRGLYADCEERYPSAASFHQALGELVKS